MEPALEEKLDRIIKLLEGVVGETAKARVKTDVTNSQLRRIHESIQDKNV